MLDLDSLALKRAKALNQKAEPWQAAVWSAAFQKASQSMSDGEVETLLTACSAVRNLETVLRFLDEHPDRSSLSPYAILLQESKTAGVSLSEWIAALPFNLGFQP